MSSPKDSPPPVAELNPQETPSQAPASDAPSQEEKPPSSEPGNAADGDPSSPQTLEDAQRLFDSGCDAVRSGDYDQAADCLSRALEIRTRHFGELAIECALTYYEYGCALLFKVQDESEALNDPAETKSKTEPVATNGSKETGQEAEGTKGEQEDEDDEDEDLEEEEESDLDLSWKMLDIARAIYEKQQCHSIQEVDAITALADVSLEREDFEMCFRDYTRALEVLEGLVESDNRRIAEVCFKLSLAQQLGYKPKEALRYCQQAVSVCEARLQRLRNEVAVATGTVDPKGKSILHSEMPEESLKPTGGGQLLDTGEEKQNLICREQKDEIKEIEQLLEELKEKVVELEETAVAPSLLESLKETNPGAVDTIQQVFTATAKLASQAASTGSSSHVESSSGGFDAPSLSASSAAVTHLGVVGRGVKRATPVCANSTANGQEMPSKKRTLDDMMTNGGAGETQIGFGSTAVGQMFSVNGQPSNPPADKGEGT